MSYAVGFIVYGVSLNKAPDSCSEDINFIQECDLAASRYSGNGESPLFVGTEMGAIDECDDIDFSYLLSFQITEEVKKCFDEDKKNLLKELDDMSSEEGSDYSVSQEFKDWLNGVEPTLFITWGSS